MKCLTPSRLTEVLIGQGCLQGTTMVTCVGAQHKPMHDDTLNALRALAQAMVNHPEDAWELREWDDLPFLIKDLLAEYDSEE